MLKNAKSSYYIGDMRETRDELQIYLCDNLIHRMTVFEVRRDLRRRSGPITFLDEGKLMPVIEVCIQLNFEYH